MQFTTLFEHLVDKLHGWLEAIVTMLPNMAVAVLVLLGFVFASRWTSRGVAKALEHLVSNQQIAALLVKGIRIGIIILGSFIALGILNLDKTVTSLLAGVGILGLALGFAFQDIAANFVSGMLMAVRRPFIVDDLVKVSDFFGRVTAVDLRATRLTQLTGETVIIPNKDVFQNAIVNYTDTSKRRVDLTVGVSYGDDLRRARELAIEAVEAIEARDDSRPVELFYTGFGGSSIDFTVRFWIDDAEQVAFLSARSAAVMTIKESFDTHGISIPFPIRTLDLGGGVVERLQALSSDDPSSSDDRSVRVPAAQ